MNNKGISYRLNWTITSIAVLIIAAIVFFNHRFSDQVLMEKIEEGAVHQSNLIVSKISRITIGTEEIARNLSYMVRYYHQHKDLDLFLNQVVASNKVLEGIQVELVNDRQKRVSRFSTSHPGDSICFSSVLSDDDFTRNLTENRNVPANGSWSDPFYCHNDTSNLFVSYRMPVYDPDTKEFEGMISCVVSLDKINKMLSSIKIGQEGYAYIIDQSGWLITHPNKKWILKRNLFDASSPIKSSYIQEIELKIKSRGRGAGSGLSEYFNHQKSWFFHAPLSNSNWTLMIIIPEKELFLAHNLNLYKTLAISALGVWILFLLNMIIFKRVLDPLARVTNAIYGFTSVSHKRGKTKDEIKMLVQSLEDWQIKYGRLVREQLKTAKEKQKFENDLKSARDIQQNIIPAGYPAFPGHPEIDLYAVLKPAESIGGDLYDYYFIDRDHLLIAIGDVSGKGIPASLFMAIASTLIKSNSNLLSPHKIIEKVNNELGERNPNQYFVTLFVGILNVRTGIMDYCNAAHNYPFILHPDGTIHTLSKSHGIPLGIYKNKTYLSDFVQLQYGDMMLLYTDGIINSRNSKGTHYGTEKLKEEIQKMNNLDAREVVTRLMKGIDIHEGGCPQSDDISMVVLRSINKEKDQV